MKRKKLKQLTAERLEKLLAGQTAILVMLDKAHRSRELRRMIAKFKRNHK
jgi:hypothetical protein